MISLHTVNDCAGGPAAAPAAPSAPTGTRSAGSEVDVWRASLDDQPLEAMEGMTALISPDEAERARSFYFDRDRRRFVVGRGILRILLGRYLGCAPAQVAFRYGAHGKPALANASVGLHFNVAHSEGLALYAFTRAGEVGVDVECMRDLPDWEQVAEAAFSPHELAQLRACAPARRRDEFFRAWTRQEAVLKALGTGLSGASGLGAESGFNVYPLDAGPGFAAALACSPAARKPDQLRGWSHRSDEPLSTPRAFRTNFL